MQERENVNRGMYDGEYFETESEREARAQAAVKRHSEIEIQAESETRSENKGHTENNAQAESEKGVKKRSFCRAQAEVFAAFLICMAAAVVGSAGYFSAKQSRPDGSGQAGGEAAGITADEERTMPGLMHVDRKEAKLQLEALGFSVEVEKEEHEDMDEGIVVMQEPAAGTQVQGGGTVLLTVSRGSELAEVPELLNRTGEEAEALLAEAQLGCSMAEEFSDTVAAGLVVSQETGAGEKLPKNTTVSICISKGPKPEEKPAESQTKTQTPSAQPAKPAASSATKEQPAPAQPQTPQGGGEAAPQPDNGGIQEENIADDWGGGGVGEEDLSGDW